MEVLVDQHLLYNAGSIGAIESFGAADGYITFFKRGTRRREIYVMMVVVHVPSFSNLPLCRNAKSER